jgi:hypothetical protein
MQQTSQIITAKKRFDGVDNTTLDFFPDAPKVEFLHNAIIDPERCLCLDENRQPTKSSLRDYIGIYDGNSKNWIRSCKRVVDKGSTPEAIKQEKEIRELAAYQYINNILSNKRIISLPDDKLYIKLISNHNNAFAHIFEDVFTKLRRINGDEILKLNKRICFLLTAVDEVVDFDKWLRALSPVREYETKFIQFRDKNLYFAPHILDIKQSSVHCNLSNTEEFDWLNEKMYNAFYNPGQKKTKLFLTRMPPLRRNIINYMQLHQELNSAGITILTGQESLEERYNAFYNATHICGYHGAMMMHLYFSNEKVRVLEYTPKNRLNKCYANLYKKTGSFTIRPINTDEKHNAILPIDEIIDFFQSDTDINSC